MQLLKALSALEQEKEYWCGKNKLYERIFNNSGIYGFMQVIIHVIHPYIEEDDICQIASGFAGMFINNDEIKRKVMKIMEPYEILFRKYGPEYFRHFNEERIKQLGLDDEELIINSQKIPLTGKKLSHYILQLYGSGPVWKESEILELQKKYTYYRRKLFESNEDKNKGHSLPLRSIAIAQMYRAEYEHEEYIKHDNYKRIAGNYGVKKVSRKIVDYFNSYRSQIDRTGNRGSTNANNAHLKNLEKALKLLSPNSSAHQRLQDDIISFKNTIS